MSFDFSLSLKGKGAAAVSEHADIDLEEATFTVSTDAETPEQCVSVSAKAFNASVSMVLGKDDLTALRNFLIFVLGLP